MTRYEYKVVPAPRRGEKSREAKTTEDRFALALTSLMNAMGRDGWDYLRADTLPCDERAGFTGTRTTVQNVLVFRRALDRTDTAAMPVPVTAADTAAVPRLGPATDAPAGPAPTIGPAE